MPAASCVVVPAETERIRVVQLAGKPLKFHFLTGQEGGFIPALPDVFPDHQSQIYRLKSGFAAGCEAEALPRRKRHFLILGLCPLSLIHIAGIARQLSSRCRRGRASASHPAAKP